MTRRRSASCWLALLPGGYLPVPEPLRYRFPPHVIGGSGLRYSGQWTVDGPEYSVTSSPVAQLHVRRPSGTEHLQVTTVARCNNNTTTARL